jgi:hypothetical protein
MAEPNRPRVVIHAEEAAKHRPMVEPTRRSTLDRKYNVKLLRQDYEVIKAAADREDRSASAFVSILIYDRIVRELAQLGEAAEDARLLMGRKADAAAQYDILTTPWLHDLMSGYCQAAIGEIAKEDITGMNTIHDLLDRFQGANSHSFKVVKLMPGF